MVGRVLKVIKNKFNVEVKVYYNLIRHSQMEINSEGIYAASDVTIFDGKVKLIATGLGEAPIAVNHAFLFVNLQ